MYAPWKLWLGCAIAMAVASGCIELSTESDAAEATTSAAVTANGIGGSNYDWYQVVGCTREPYGIIANYGTPSVRTTVQSQLATMHGNGQDRLRIAIFHGRGLGGGTLLDSTGGNLSPAMRTKGPRIRKSTDHCCFARGLTT
jgi:hypothetical protein